MTHIVETISISELLRKKYKYRIPSFQRGYKWRKKNVEFLLEDILEFSNSQKEGQIYCLQPIVVQNLSKINKQEILKYIQENIPNEDINKQEIQQFISHIDRKNHISVIDGQQRLTTLYLILCYLEESNLFQIEYDKRPGSLALLEQIKTEKKYDPGQLPLYYLSTKDNSYDYVGCTSVSVETFDLIQNALSKGKNLTILLYAPFPPVEYYNNLINYIQLFPNNKELLTEPKIDYEDWHPEELSYNPESVST